MAASALDWWREAGIDMLVDEAPRHWLHVEPGAGAQVGAAPARAPVPFDIPLPDTIEAFAAWRPGADTPDAGWAGPKIAAQGNPGSDVMILIEMPERDDAETGILLSGAPGALFDRMLAAIGRDRASIYLAPLCIARPPASRVPPEAIEPLGRIMRHQIMLAGPKRLLVIGNAASRAILGADIATLRGSLHSFNHGKGNVGVVTSFHPRFLIERPAAKAEAWRDLQLLMKEIDA